MADRAQFLDVAWYKDPDTGVLRPGEGAQVTVYLAPPAAGARFTTLAQIFSDDSGAGTPGNPFITESGAIDFWAEENPYDIVIEDVSGDPKFEDVTKNWLAIPAGSYYGPANPMTGEFVFHTFHAFSLDGPVEIGDRVPGLSFDFADGQNSELVKIRHYTEIGAIDFKTRFNGSDLSGWNDASSTTPDLLDKSSTPQALVSGNRIELEVTARTTGAEGLSGTYVVRHTIAY